jgi:hypothetical protein
MEKLLDFDKESSANDEKRYRMYRAQCDCMSAPHAMDIDVEVWGQNDEHKAITIRMDTLPGGFWSRVREGWNVFRGKWSWREFVVRSEDYKQISEIFDPDKKYQDLP